MDSFSGIGPNGKKFPVETASHFYAMNSIMAMEPLQIQWDASVQIVYRDNVGNEHPDDSLQATGGPQTFWLFRDTFSYEGSLQDTKPLELRSSYAIQNAETEYGPIGPGQVNTAEFHADYMKAFHSSDATFQDKVGFLTHWFAPKEQRQQPMTDAQAIAALTK